MTDLTKNAFLPSINVIQLTCTLKITSAQVVEMSVIVNSSPILDYARPDNHATPIYRCIINHIHPRRPRRCCLLIGHNNTKHFCAQSGANIRLTIWKWSSESGYPGAFPPVLENFHCTISPGQTDHPWVSEDEPYQDRLLIFHPLPTRAKYTQQPATFLNDQSSFLNDQTFGDFICLRTYIYVLGC